MKDVYPNCCSTLSDGLRVSLWRMVTSSGVESLLQEAR